MLDAKVKILLLLVGFAISGTANQSAAQKAGDETVLLALNEGMEAFQNGEHAQAEKHFDEAIARISAIWSNTVDAQKARSNWSSEEARMFLGEAYERMMAFYYRGLLYLREGDHGNAQASFLRGWQQDAFFESTSKEGRVKRRADAYSQLFLRGWALQAQGSIETAEENYRIAGNALPNLEVPDVSRPQPSVLLIVETGLAPVKIADGVDQDTLKYFRRRGFDDVSVLYSLDDEDFRQIASIEDVYWQAATRGVREYDVINDQQSRVSYASRNVGGVVAEVGSALTEQSLVSGNSTEGTVGLAATAVGAAALLFSSKTDASVDDRHWETLPDAIHAVPLRLTSGRHRIHLKFRDDEGNHVQSLARTIEIEVPDATGQPVLTWVSAHKRESSEIK